MGSEGAQRHNVGVWLAEGQRAEEADTTEGTTEVGLSHRRGVTSLGWGEHVRWEALHADSWGA